jgi:hypothetical protein
MPTVYVASKARHHSWWRALRAAGVPIAASWIDWDANRDALCAPNANEWAEHWQRCIDEAAAADVLLFVAFEDERQCGALVELGAALAAGKTCYVVSPHEWTVANHPRCRTFATLADAVAAIAQDNFGKSIHPPI